MNPRHGRRALGRQCICQRRQPMLAQKILADVRLVIWTSLIAAEASVLGPATRRCAQRALANTPATACSVDTSRTILCCRKTSAGPESAHPAGQPGL